MSIKSLFLAVTMVFGAATAQAATIVNGSFEAPTATSGSFNTYAAGSGLLSGWTISNASIDHIGNGFWQASDGVQSVDLNGNQGPSTISQVVTGLVAGKTYNILFDLAGNPQGQPTVKTIDVSIGMAGAGSYSFDTSGATTGNMGWQTKTLSFVAGGTSGLLSFASTTALCCWGPALDNVRIEEVTSAVPLPAGGVLLLTGLGVIALRRRRR